jgi:hypothetical protein
MIYQYECALGHVQERDAPLREWRTPIECPCCYAQGWGRRMARRILSPTPSTFHFNDQSKSNRK